VRVGGSTVQAQFQTGTYLPRSYAIMTAGAINGSFGALASTGVPTGLAATLSYTPTAVDLNLNSVLSQTTGLNGNQSAVARAIDTGFSTGNGVNAAFSGLYGAAAGTVPPALTRLSGEIATGAPTATFRTMGQFLGQILDPFLDRRLGDIAPSGRVEGGGPRYAQAVVAPGMAQGMAAIDAGTPFALGQNWASWGTVYGASGSVDGMRGTGSSSLNTNNVGGAGGIDYRLSPTTLVGMAVGGGGTDWSLNSGGAGHSDDVEGGIYGTSRFGNAYVSGAFAYGHHDLSTNRTVLVGAVSDRLTGNVGADHVAGRAETGERFQWMPDFGVTPYAAVQVRSLSTPGYAETDRSGLTAFALNYAGNTTTDTTSELGAKFDSQAYPVIGPFGETQVILHGRAAWSHDFSPSRTALANFQNLPGATFTVAGAPEASDAALLSAGAEMRLSRTMALGAKFDGAFSGRSQVFAGTAVLRINW